MPRKNHFQKEHPNRREYVALKNPGFFDPVNERPRVRRRDSIDNEYSRLIAKESINRQPVENLAPTNVLMEKANGDGQHLDFELANSQKIFVDKADVKDENETLTIKNEHLQVTEKAVNQEDNPLSYTCASSRDLSQPEEPEVMDWATEAFNEADNNLHWGSQETECIQYAATKATKDFESGPEAETSDVRASSLPEDNTLKPWTTIPTRIKRTSKDSKKTSDASGGRGCFNCGQEGHMKNECTELPKSNGCFNCGLEGHIKSECPEPLRPREKACRNCGDTSHMARDCPEPGADVHAGGDSGGARSDRECYNCHEIGHISRNCLRKASGGGGQRGENRGCFNCGEDGHISRECPVTPGIGSRGTGCFKCGEEGHKSRECSQGRNPGGGACYKCGESGHIARDCGGERRNASVRWDEPSTGGDWNDSGDGFSGPEKSETWVSQEETGCFEGAATTCDADDGTAVKW